MCSRPPIRASSTTDGQPGDTGADDDDPSDKSGPGPEDLGPEHLLEGSGLGGVRPQHLVLEVEEAVVALHVPARSATGVTGGSKPSNQMSSSLCSSSHSAWNSGVVVAYQSRASPPARLHASVTQADTVWWSGCPVMPSGPKVTRVSGCTRSIRADLGHAGLKATSARHRPCARVTRARARRCARGSPSAGHRVLAACGDRDSPRPSGWTSSGCAQHTQGERCSWWSSSSPEQHA